MSRVGRSSFTNLKYRRVAKIGIEPLEERLALAGSLSRWAQASQWFQDRALASFGGRLNPTDSARLVRRIAQGEVSVREASTRGDNLRALMIRLASSQEEYVKAGGHHEALARNFLTPSQRQALDLAVARSLRIEQVWLDRLAAIARGPGAQDPVRSPALRGVFRSNRGFERVLAWMLASDRLKGRVNPPTDTSPPSTSENSSSSQTFEQLPLSVGTGAAVPLQSPWTGASILPQVSYAEISRGDGYAPQFFYPNTNLLNLNNLSSGYTFSIWFQAATPGVLLGTSAGIGPDFGGGSVTLPLLMINDSGYLQGGFYDQTPQALNLIDEGGSQGVLTSPVSLVSASGEVFVGAPNPIVSQLSVLDASWHQASLVVQGETQWLYLDGLLQGKTGAQTGSYGLAPTVNLPGMTFTSPIGLVVGGAVSPEPVTNLGPQINFPQGLIGALDEVALWSEALSASEVQQVITAPAGQAPFGTALQAYFPFTGGGGQALVNQRDSAGSTLFPVGSAAPSITLSTIPTDPFPAAIRLPGSRDFGIHQVTPFAAPTALLAPNSISRFKFGLSVGDVLNVMLPDSVAGALTVTVQNDAQTSPSTPWTIPPGNSLAIPANRAGTYLVTLSWKPVSAKASVNVAFNHQPGVTNSLALLLSSYQIPSTSQATVVEYAYSDPSYPTINPTIGTANPTGPANYWPLWSDSTVFPTTRRYSAAGLADAYAQLVNAATTHTPGFSSFTNLDKAAVFEPAELLTALRDAYRTVTKSAAPTPAKGESSFPIAAESTAVDAVYKFLYNANQMQQTVIGFINGTGAGAGSTSLVQWLTALTLQLSSSPIPANIASQIAIGQSEQVQSISVSAPIGKTANSSPHYFDEAVSVGLTWLVAKSLFVEDPILGYAVGEAGEAVFESLFGLNHVPPSVNLTVPVQSLTNSIVDFENLSSIASSLVGSYSETWTNILQTLGNDQFIQTVLSNYGLLKALSTISANSLDLATTSAQDTLSTTLANASWRAMIPAVFTVQPVPVFQGTSSTLAPSESASVANFATFWPNLYQSSNLANLSGNGVTAAVAAQLQALQSNGSFAYPGLNNSGLITSSWSGDQNNLPLGGPYPPPAKMATFAATNTTGPNLFYSVTNSSLNLSQTYDVTQSDSAGDRVHGDLNFNLLLSGQMVSAWNLFDANNNPIAPATAAQLLGTGVSKPLNASNPVVGFNAAWIAPTAALTVPTASGGSTRAPATWAELFFTWGGGFNFVTQTAAPGTAIPAMVVNQPVPATILSNTVLPTPLGEFSYTYDTNGQAVVYNQSFSPMKTTPPTPSPTIPTRSPLRPPTLRFGLPTFRGRPFVARRRR